MRKGIGDNKMNRCLFLFFLIFTFYSHASNFDLPIIHSEKNNNQCEILFDSKVVSKHVCEYAPPSFLKSYSLILDSWTSVWIFQDASEGNSCEGGPIRVISADSDKKLKNYPAIDYCSGKIVVKSNGDEVNIDIFSGTDGVLSESWLFKDLSLKRIK